MIRFIRIYTPFICSIMTLINGVYFLLGGSDNEITYTMSSLTGNSFLIVLYVYCTSLKMCIWYKLNLFCLFLIQTIGLLYEYTNISIYMYFNIVILLSIIGIICFLVFRIFYRTVKIKAV